MPTFSTPVHPGEILREEFLVPFGLSAGAVAKAIDVPRTRIERVIAERMGITADTALRLAKYFGTSPDVWMNLQKNYEIAVAGRALGHALDRIQTRANDNDAPPAVEARHA